MGFTATPVDGSTPPLPLPTAVPDGTNTPLAVEAGPSKSTGGNTLVPVAVYLYDGYDVTQGLTTDAAVVGDNTGTVSAKLRGLSKILNSVWDSASNLLAVKIQATTAGGSTLFHVISAASNNATSLKGSAGHLYGGSVSNTNAAARFVKFYNKASAPAPATDNALILWTIQVPANATVLFVAPEGGVFGTGIGFAAVANMSDTDNTSIGAGDLSIDLRYK